MEYQIEDAERSGGSREWRGVVNGQTTKRDPKLRWKCWVGLFINMLGTNVPSSPIHVTLMMEALSSSKTSVLTRATRRNNAEAGIIQH
jgi:hypothetical protein